MFDLENAIAEWRSEMLAAGVHSSATLDELESHLRESVRVRIIAGHSEQQAFEQSATALGDPAMVQTEFRKIEAAQSRYVKLALYLWSILSVLLAAGISSQLFRRRINFLTYAHIVTITTSYVTVLLMGSIAIYHTYRSLRYSPRRGANPFRRIVCLFSRVGLGFLVVGMVLGLCVSKQRFGEYWRWQPAEMGGLCVLVWLLIFTAWQFTREMRVRAVMLMSISASIWANLAWFGPFVIYEKQRRHEFGNHWVFAWFLAVQVSFVILGVLRDNAVVISSAPQQN
jgi:hypothetical protein